MLALCSATAKHCKQLQQKCLSLLQIGNCNLPLFKEIKNTARSGSSGIFNAGAECISKLTAHTESKVSVRQGFAYHMLKTFWGMQACGFGTA